MTRASRILACASLVGAALGACSVHAELKSSYPLRDDCGPEFEKLFWEHHARTAKSGIVPSVRDQDRNNIAILEDDGLLVSFITTQTFQGWVTNSSNIARRFYATRPDTYDYLVIFVASTFDEDVQTDGGGVAFELNVANDVEGLGLEIFNNGHQVVPTLTNLRSIVNMNDLGEYGEDPAEGLPGLINTFSGIDILAQEAEHMVGAFVSAPGGDILGRGNTHWSFFLETYGSVMEGNSWRDNGDGTFTTIESVTGYSQLDLYLYGLIDVPDVTDPMHVILFPTPSLGETGGDATIPVEGVTIFGPRTEITAEGIAIVNGARVPNAADAPKSFSMGWVLVIPQGTEPAEHDLEKIDEFRAQWEEFFRIESNGIGSMQVRLGAAPVSADFEARVFAGEPGVTVPFDNDSFGNVDSYEWDFGDGTTSDERHPTHTYNEKGTYTVRLIVRGEGGMQVAEKIDFVQVGDVTTYFFDDFESERGWFRDTRDNAGTGLWVRTNPEPTAVRVEIGGTEIEAIVQPDEDHTPNGVQCYVTGNAPRGAALGANDVDAGRTAILSPILDLSAARDPILSFWFWFSNNSGAAPGRDPFVVEVSNNAGVSWVTMKSWHSSHHHWREEQLHLADYLPLTSRMRVRFEASDLGVGSLVEAAIDDVHIFDVDTRTPVTLQDFFAATTSEGIELHWRLAPEAVPQLAQVVVQRAESPAGVWETRTTLPPRSDMRFVDADVTFAQPWYRLALERHNGAIEHSAPLRATAPAQVTAFTSASATRDGSVSLRFALAREASVDLDIYSVDGRRMATVTSGRRPAGEHLVVWERRDDRGARVPRGVYFVRFRADGVTQSHKLALLH